MATTIKTAGDLKKALSAYDDNLPLALFFRAADGTQKRAEIGTDLQIYAASFEGRMDSLEIWIDEK
jgi:hypothetical protein